MRVNAPEKLYLSKNIYSTFIYQVPDPDDDTAVEYTRTDAFMKKACDAYCKACCNKPSYSVPIPFCRRKCESYNNFIKNIKL
jgi:hypothetical protein